jgi:hypothetical protein
MKNDWSEITSLAYFTLLELNLHDFPILINNIKCKGVKISSYQKYAALTGISVEKITLGNELNDAFLLKGLRPGIDIILYDEEKLITRMKHTLLHEIGHIKCGHSKHGEQEEIEAHFFASQVNAPTALLKVIEKRGYNIDVQLLMSGFGLSEEAAKKKMDYLGRYGFEHTNENDDLVLIQFNDFINEKYPISTQRFYDDYFDDLDHERDKWNY